MENYQLQLVDNSYNVEDAQAVLFSLLNDKMKFLKLKLLDTLEDYGSCSPELEQRLEDLKTEKERLYDILKYYARQEDIRLDIDCMIDIKIKKAIEILE